MKLTRRIASSLAPLALLAASSAAAVQLSADGVGQALIYPYYTVQTATGGAFNTLISVVNVTAERKVIRVRFREGRNGREVASFNLYLSGHDTWTGAVVPSPAGAPASATLISFDRACTNPPYPFTATGGPASLPFSNAAYSVFNNDGGGEGLERTREGYIEMIEMATLTGASANASTTLACTELQGENPALELAPPGGGLSGTLTLVNVASGLDFTLNAVALADLTRLSIYRPPSDRYPDFDSVEVNPVSVIASNGVVRRLEWGRSVDAVSAVLMSDQLEGEFVLDAGTRSLTDHVITFPTRRFYVTPTSAVGPFAPRAFGAEPAGGTFDFGAADFNRDGVTASPRCSYFDPFGAPIDCRPLHWTWAVNVLSPSNGAPHTVGTAGSHVLGSRNGHRLSGDAVLPLFANNANGFVRYVHTINGARPVLVSRSVSVSVDLRNGSTTPGAYAVFGLPAVGFLARTFENGTLSCSAGNCQGNYGGAFPLTTTQLPSP